MNRQWMKAGAALLTLAALGVTAGCGGAPAKSSPEKAAASGAAERTLKVACIATYPPFVYKDKEDKKEDKKSSDRDNVYRPGRSF